MTGRDFNIFTHSLRKGRNGLKLLPNERETKTIWLSLIVPFLLSERYGKLPVVVEFRQFQWIISMTKTRGNKLHPQSQNANITGGTRRVQAGCNPEHKNECHTDLIQSNLCAAVRLPHDADGSLTNMTSFDLSNFVNIGVAARGDLTLIAAVIVTTARTSNPRRHSLIYETMLN